MRPADFAETKERLCAIADAVAGVELDELLDVITRTELAAPLLPDEGWELWENGGADELAALKRLARALRPFRDEVLRQLEARRSAA